MNRTVIRVSQAHVLGLVFLTVTGSSPIQPERDDLSLSPRPELRYVCVVGKILRIEPYYQVDHVILHRRWIAVERNVLGTDLLRDQAFIGGGGNLEPGRRIIAFGHLIPTVDVGQWPEKTRPYVEIRSILSRIPRLDFVRFLEGPAADLDQPTLRYVRESFGSPDLFISKTISDGRTLGETVQLVKSHYPQTKSPPN